MVAEESARRAAESAYREVYQAMKAAQRSRALLVSLLPEAQRQEFQTYDRITLQGAEGRHYQIHRDRQTVIYELHKLPTCACLQLTEPAPVYDRMIAEYLLIRNDEARYWATANVMPPRDTPRLGPIERQYREGRVRYPDGHIEVRPIEGRYRDSPLGGGIPW